MNTIEVTDSEKDKVYSWLRDFNHKENGAFMRSLEIEGTEIPIFLSARDEQGKIIGGLEGMMIHKWLRINIMAVCPSCRRKGVGTTLVTRAEALAIENDCHYSFVDTMSFQAPEFYQHLYYDIVGRIPDWDSHGHDKIYLTKNLKRSSGE